MNDSLTTDDASAEALMGEIIDAFMEQLGRGEQPEVEAYARHYPQLATVLRQILPALQVIHVSASDHPRPTNCAVPEIEPEGPLGDFRIVREIGRGGMGVVYEAVQISLGRRVALKILPFAAAMDPKQLQRFKNEAQAAAHLQHQHIVPVHYVGCERGVHFYAMQYIEGQTLAAVIRELRQLAKRETASPAPAADAASALASELVSGRWAPVQRRAGEVVEAGGREEPTGPYLPACPAPGCPTTPTPPDATPPMAALSTERSTKNAAFFRTVAQLGVQAAEALEHAHQLGVIHRDIKPANLLIDVGGHLWVADFGLAKLGNEAGLTMTGDLVGTLRYMSPEQALAKRVTVDARTDVYSLGVTLYELLTLEPAYNGRNREEVLRQIAFEEPRPPSRLNKAAPTELETIILKAMAKSLEERYATAQELADDLRRFLEDKPIKAKRPSLWQRAVKWARRHKTVVRAAVVVLVLAVAALAVISGLIWRVNRELRQNLYFQNIALAEREWSANNLVRVEQLLDACPVDLRGWEWRYLKRLRYKPLAPLRHDGALHSVAFRADGALLAAGDQRGWVTLWDVQSGCKLVSFRAHQEHALSVAFSPDGKRLATGGGEETAKVWNVERIRPDELPPQLCCFHLSEGVNSVAFSPDGQLLACAGQELEVWDTISWQQSFSLPRQSAFINCVAFSSDSRRLATANADTTVAVWDARTGRKIQTLLGHQFMVHCVAFSPDDRLLASGAGLWNTQSDGELKVWDARTGRELFTLPGHISRVHCVTFSPDGKRLASASLDQTIKLWDTATGQEVLTLRGHDDLIRGLAFSPDGQQLASGSLDRTVRIWDARPGQDDSDRDCLTLRGHGAVVNAVAFNPVDPRVIVSASADGTVRLWDAWTAQQLQIFRGHSGPVEGVAFSPDGRSVASASQDRSVRVWDATSGKEIHLLSGHTSYGPLSIAFDREGRRLVSGGYDRVLRVWDLATRKQIAELPGNSWVIHGVAFSPDDRHVASAGEDGTVRVWDLAAGKEIVSPPLHDAGRVVSVAFNHDGGRLVAASMDRTVKVWDTASWKLLHLLRDPTGGGHSIAFSPDGKRIAWGGTDSMVKIWDEASGEIIYTLRGHTSWVQGVAFSPDGKRLASASADRIIKIWEVPPVSVAPGH